MGDDVVIDEQGGAEAGRRQSAAQPATEASEGAQQLHRRETGVDDGEQVGVEQLERGGGRRRGGGHTVTVGRVGDRGGRSCWDFGRC